MPPQDLGAAIIQVVGQSDDGLSVEALQRAFPDVARRTANFCNRSLARSSRPAYAAMMSMR